ncbi:MAG TPA: ABC transporter permease [Steroidobacteraceae bacterium]
MFRNYLTTALRNFARHKLYSLINVAGLSVGLACAIVIVLFLRDELSYDGWIPGSAQLYRVEVTVNVPGRDPQQLAVSPFPLPRAMREQIPEVTAMTRLAPQRMTVTVGNREFSETVMVVDPNFFRVIRLPLLEGNPADVFSQPESLVLSKAMARKYFGDVDPLGKTVLIGGAHCNLNGSACQSAVHSLTVTGVLRDLPHNTQLVADVVLPNSSQADPMPAAEKEEWLDQNDYGYVTLAPGANLDAVLAKLKPILDRSINPEKLAVLNMRGSELEQVHLTPFRNAHLTSDKYNGLKPAGSWTTVYGFAAIALLILLVACFNFTNLATARAMLRAREISIRKAVGAKRRQLMVQLLGEALLMALVSLVVALALVEILLPDYDAFLDRPIGFQYLGDWPLFAGIIASTIIAGLLSGTYPALVLSSFRPAAVLKMSASAPGGSGRMRVMLVVSQFAVSIGLGIAAIVVFSQISYARNIDLGFDRDGIVIIGGANNLTPIARDSLANILRGHPRIASVALSGAFPLEGAMWNRAIQIPGAPQNLIVRSMNIGPEFPSLYGIRLLAGRLLSHDRGADALPADGLNEPQNEGRNILINAAAARRFGYSVEEAVGKALLFEGAHVTIVGVLGDSKVDGVKRPIVPMVYYSYPEGNAVFSVRLQGSRASDTLADIDKAWRSFAPDTPIQRYFLSAVFESQFTSDEKQGAMFGLFVGIAILIACLGLFGLAAFTVERRTKEIGIRKVFGARSSDIVRLLLWQFSIPVLIANAIAWPVAYYYLHHWLESYAYRISLSPVYFVLAGAVALAIAWFTVFVHALRVARASPIRALRYE